MTSDPTPYHWKILGLTDSEIKIMMSLTKMAKNSAVISRHAQIPKGTLSYSLQKLKKRDLLFIIKKGKKIYWKSNFPRIIRHFQSLDYKKYGKY